MARRMTPARREADRVADAGRHPRRWVGVAWLVVGLLLPHWASAEQPPLTPEERQQALAALDPRYVRWVRSVLGLISEEELDYFLRLSEDFRRDSFQQAFWVPRDPDPGTPQNELKERWEALGGESGEQPLQDARYILLLLNGPPGGWGLPDGRIVGRCFSKTTELEIWFYGSGVSEREQRRFPVILYRRFGASSYDAYRLGSDLTASQRSGGLPTNDIRLLCADELLRYTLNEVRRDPGYTALVERVLSPPLPPPEWLAAFRSGATDLPEGVSTFELVGAVRHPYRRGSRSAVEVVLPVPRSAVPGRYFDGVLHHAFELVGEVVRDGALFDTFRYRFEGPTLEAASEIPLGFTRLLRQGSASVRVLVHDLYGDRWARWVGEIAVPSSEGLPELPTALPEKPAAALELLAPPGEPLTGRVRFNARAGIELDRVSFFLDDQQVLSKRSPPYSVELDLGDVPEPHRVRVVGMLGGREVATDQIWLNQGPARFQVRLVEPRSGGIYPGSTTVRAEVEIPGGGSLERLEVLTGDEVVAVLVDQPFSVSVPLPAGGPVVLRARARLTDGSEAEDTVVVNGSSWSAAVTVRTVEVPVVVRGRNGEAVRGLGVERFRLYEEGEERPLASFRELADAPLHLSLLVDRSVSMTSQLPAVAAAANQLARQALTGPEDRVAVYSFADRLAMDSGPTASTAEVERALAGLAAGGRTALYDALLGVLASLEGAPSGEAVILVTDGLDEVSETTTDQLSATVAQRGVPLYLLGLGEAFREAANRRRLEELAALAGGRAVFVESPEGLPTALADVLDELRSRYLLSFDAGDPESGSLRRLRVEVDAPGTRVIARSAYRP